MLRIYNNEALFLSVYESEKTSINKQIIPQLVKLCAVKIFMNLTDKLSWEKTNDFYMAQNKNTVAYLFFLLETNLTNFVVPAFLTVPFKAIGESFEALLQVGQ